MQLWHRPGGAARCAFIVSAWALIYKRLAERGRTYASTLLDLGNAVLRLDAIAIHLHILILIIGSLDLGTLTSSLTLNRSDNDFPDLLQRAFEILNIVEHLADFALRG